MLKTAKDSKRAGTVLLTLKKGVITRSVYKFWFNHIYENGEDRHFKFRLLIDAQKCYHMHDIIYYPERDVRYVTRPLKFCRNE